MTGGITDHRTSDGHGPTSPRLLQSPMDYIAEDHLRLRTMCGEMDKLADSDGPAPADLDALHTYLIRDLPLLLADEDEGLMPLVLSRAEPEDELPKLARRLDREHREIERLLALVAGALPSPPGQGSLPAPLRQALRDLAQATRRHLFLENAVLLPLARARLTRADLARLRDAMRRRRGLEPARDD